MTETKKDTMREQVTQLLSAPGYGGELKYEAFFRAHAPVEPWSNNRVDWNLVLSNTRASMPTEYHVGLGHYTKNSKPNRYDLSEIVARGVYPGSSKLLKKPDLLDVVHCLVLDAAIVNHFTYESWAMDYGYEQDSREGERIYNLCRKQTADFLKLIGGQGNLAKLQELFQDY